MEVNLTEKSKPRLLFVRQKITKNSAKFQNYIEDEIVRVLSFHFQLHKIEEDFDYEEVCNKINPDIVLFDTPGGNRQTPINIKNIKKRKDIPRTALYTQDPHDTSRVTFLRLIDQWEIEYFFTFSVATIRQSPEISGRCYVIPLYFDDDIFHDYKLEKTIPASIFGGIMAPGFYHWRAKTAQILHSEIPTLIYTHPGYSDPIPAHRYPIRGKAYARMINSSFFSLSDPTRLDYVVRKHIEIPASASILVTQNTAETLRHGFIDMENCILGEGKELIEKISSVAESPELYDKILKNGYDHVHQKFSVKNWTYINDWYKGFKSLKPNEELTQDKFHGKFIKVARKEVCFSKDNAVECLRESEFSDTMHQSFKIIQDNGNLSLAHNLLVNIINWGCAHIYEPRLLLAIIELLQGNIDNAKKLTLSCYHIRANREGFTFFDPEELSLLHLLLFLKHDDELQNHLLSEDSNLRHVSLRRMNWLKIAVLEQKISCIPNNIITRQRDDHISTHWLGQIEFKIWLNLMRRIFEANDVEFINNDLILSVHEMEIYGTI